MKSTEGEQYWRGWKTFCSEDELPEEAKKKWLKDLRKSIPIIIQWDDATIKHTIDILQREFSEYMSKDSRTEFYSFFNNYLNGVPESLDDVYKVIEETTGPIKRVRKPSGKVRKKDTMSGIIEKLERLTIFDDHELLLENHSIYTNYSIWDIIFKSEKPKTEMKRILRRIKKIKTVLARRTVKLFEADIKAIENLKYSDDYQMTKKLSFHQKFVAVKIRNNPGWLDASKTGSGKTLAALTGLAQSKFKRIIVICPNNIVDQWGAFINASYPDSDIVLKNDVLNHSPSSRRTFYVLNYEKISLGLEENKRGTVSNDYTRIIKKFNPDAIIMDEVHNVKQRGSDKTKRRKNLEHTMKAVRRKNPECKMILTSATIVPNSLDEARSILDLLNNRDNSSLSRRGTFQAAAYLHVELLKYMTRFMKKYKHAKKIITIDIPNHSLHLDKPGRKEEIEGNGKVPGWTWLDFEREAIVAKIPYIKKLLGINKNNTGHATIPKNKKVIIFTKYVTGIVDEIQRQLESKGTKCALFTGSDKTGITGQELGKFFESEYRVLIASSPVAEGLDSLQGKCSHIIVAGYPWTNTELEQVIGRLDRTGQKNTVKVYQLNATLSGYEYDKRLKTNRLSRKRTIAKCAIDGEYESKILQLPRRLMRSQMIEKMIESDLERRINLAIGQSPLKLHELKLHRKHDRMKTKVRQAEAKKKHKESK